MSEPEPVKKKGRAENFDGKRTGPKKGSKGKKQLPWDMRWVLIHLEDKPEPPTFPNPTTKTMFKWAKREPDKFMMKAMTMKADLAKQEEKPEEKVVEAVEGLVDSLLQGWDQELARLKEKQK